MPPVFCERVIDTISDFQSSVYKSTGGREARNPPSIWHDQATMGLHALPHCAATLFSFEPTRVNSQSFQGCPLTPTVTCVRNATYQVRRRDLY